jgi:hypothetical protein
VTPFNSAGEQKVGDMQFQLIRNALGRWVLKLGASSDQTMTESQQLQSLSHLPEVIVVRAFPIEAPNQGISILSLQGHELVWIDDLDQLSQEQKDCLLQAIREREFMPEILKLEGVSGFISPCTWTIQTSRGRTELELRGEEDIRRLSSKTLIVSDKYGVQYLIKDLPNLDRHSRKLLDRFF